MINHRFATEVACRKLFSAETFDDFSFQLDAFNGSLKDMADKAQYTMISHALSAFDQAFLDADLDNERILAVSRLLPLSLQSCMKALDEVNAEGARELALNITKHETYEPHDKTYIEEVIGKFGKRKFSENIGMLLEGLFKIPHGDQEFDYQGFVDTLHHAFEDDFQETIDWAIAFEKSFMGTNFPSIVSIYSTQAMGNMFYRKGLRGLGRLIMEETASSAKGLELHEREQFLGIRVSVEERKQCGTEPMVCFMLGTQYIEREWFDTKLHGLNGPVISRAHHLMKLSDIGVIHSSLEQVCAIGIGLCTKYSDLKSMLDVMKELKVTIPKELADHAINKCLPFFLSKPADIIEIHGYQELFGATIDFSPYKEKIAENVNTWAEADYLSPGDILSCHYGSSEQFPCSHLHIATAVDGNWSHWNEKERRIALDQLPREVFLKSRQLKGLKVSDDLGL